VDPKPETAAVRDVVGEQSIEFIPRFASASTRRGCSPLSRSKGSNWMWCDSKKVDVTSLEFCSKRKEQNMRRSRFSEEQIIGILLRAEAGSPVKPVCAANNISAPRLPCVEEEIRGIEVSEANRLRALEEENSRLKCLVADQGSAESHFKEINAKKW
jgi:putative transposase